MLFQLLHVDQLSPHASSRCIYYAYQHDWNIVGNFDDSYAKLASLLDLAVANQHSVESELGCEVRAAGYTCMRTACSSTGSLSLSRSQMKLGKVL